MLVHIYYLTLFAVSFSDGCRGCSKTIIKCHMTIADFVMLYQKAQKVLSSVNPVVCIMYVFFGNTYTIQCDVFVCITVFILTWYIHNTYTIHERLYQIHTCLYQIHTNTMCLYWYVFVCISDPDTYRQETILASTSTCFYFARRHQEGLRLTPHRLAKS